MYISSERIELELTIRGYMTAESWHEVNDWLLRNLVPRDASIDVIKGINTTIKVSWYSKKPDVKPFKGAKDYESGRKIIREAQKPKPSDLIFEKYNVKNLPNIK